MNQAAKTGRATKPNSTRWKGRAVGSLRRDDPLVLALHRMAESLLQRSDPDGLIEDIAWRAAKLAGASDAYVYLVDEARDSLVVRVGLGPLMRKYVGLRLARGEGVAGKVMDMGHTLVVQDYATWEGRSSKISSEDVRAVVCLPLAIDARIVGVLGVCHTVPGAHFSEDEIWTLEEFARLASVALDHARLVTSLRASEESFRIAFEQSPVGRTLSTLDGRWLRVNRALCEMTGYTEHELLRLGWREVTWPEDRAETEALRAELVAGLRRSYDIEKRYVRKDGRLIWVRTTASLVRDEAGHARYFLGEVQDVTDAREQAVTRKLVRTMLQRVADAGSIPPNVMRELGRSLAAGVAGRSMAEYARAFSHMGLGRLKVAQEGENRWQMTGEDLLELAPGAAQPGCRMPLGFLEGAAQALSGHDALGTELRCQSMGHPECVFVVMGRPPPKG